MESSWKACKNTFVLLRCPTIQRSRTWGHDPGSEPAAPAPECTVLTLCSRFRCFSSKGAEFLNAGPVCTGIGVKLGGCLPGRAAPSRERLPSLSASPQSCLSGLCPCPAAAAGAPSTSARAGRRESGGWGAPPPRGPANLQRQQRACHSGPAAGSPWRPLLTGRDPRGTLRLGGHRWHEHHYRKAHGLEQRPRGAAGGDTWPLGSARPRTARGNQAALLHPLPRCCPRHLPGPIPTTAPRREAWSAGLQPSRRPVARAPCIQGLHRGREACGLEGQSQEGSHPTPLALVGPAHPRCCPREEGGERLPQASRHPLGRACTLPHQPG